MTIRSWLRCMNCGHEDTLGPQFFACAECGGQPLEVAYDYGQPAVRLDPRPKSIWEFADLLPQIPDASRITLGEGGSPLVDVKIGDARAWVKNEGVNPTLSFKDRFSAVNVSVAKALGFSRITLSSTGNAGMAAAAYAAHGGLAARVYCPPETPEVIRQSIRAFGAELLIRPRSEHGESVEQDVRSGFFPGSRGMPFRGVTPFGAEGYKTISYEIAAVLSDAADVVYVPLGGGDAVYGIYKGFTELATLGLTHRVPRMIGVHCAGPLAFSIAGDAAGSHAERAILSSGGQVLSVSESEIVEAVQALGTQGILAEPASAASVAGFIKAQTVIPSESECSVCVITSSLIKWFEHLW